MKKMIFAAFCLMAAAVPVSSQSATSHVSVRVILLDKDLNQKPVPHLSIALAPDSNDSANSIQLRTDFAGSAEIQALPGKYRLLTPEGFDFQGHHYEWEMEINVGDSPASVELSNDNARITIPRSLIPRGKSMT